MILNSKVNNFLNIDKDVVMTEYVPYINKMIRNDYKVSCSFIFKFR
jgi:hypothetical protein